MQTIAYQDYLDRVWGCWLGKCISGTIGAPYEGMKQLMDIQFSPALVEKMLPNDDLDLQVLWLAVLEQKGEHFTSEDLADAFYTRCLYAPGEYAVFKKNFARGIHPPVTGGFSNGYYLQGMGCPIRSEIWGCVAPGNPVLAADLASRDGVLDHEGESVYAEQFLAAIEAAAFFESDLHKLYSIGLSFVPQSSRLYRLINDTLVWCASDGDWRLTRSRIIRSYGHPDCTNMFQNIGVTLLALEYGGGDLLETTMIALNCGFDTDCTCATAGALLGIFYGAERIFKQYGFTDQTFVLGVDAPRRSEKVYDLAEDTCRVGLHFTRTINRAVQVSGLPSYGNADQPFQTGGPLRINEPLQIDPPPALSFAVDYHGQPAISLGESKRLTVRMTNQSGEVLRGAVSLAGPAGWPVELLCSDALELAPGATVLCDVRVDLPKALSQLDEINRFTFKFSPQTGLEGLPGSTEFVFGLTGAAVWEVFGPFWQNLVEVPPLKIGESYFAHLGPSTSADDSADRVRQYHLNAFTDWEREYLTLDELTGEEPPALEGDASRERQLVCTPEDKFSVNDLVGWQGPCIVYAVRRLVSPEDRTVFLEVGHSDSFSLTINGQLITERQNADWWTAENVHVSGVKLKQGVNTVVLKLARRSDRAVFSLNIAKTGPCAEKWPDFSSQILVSKPEPALSLVK